MTSEEPPTLKCVVAWSERRPLLDLLAGQLAESAGAGNVLRLGDVACVVHTAEQPAALRDRLSDGLNDGEWLLVLEFERWSSYGRGVDPPQAGWLLARGH